jgi:hypothetical protein
MMDLGGLWRKKQQDATREGIIDCPELVGAEAGRRKFVWWVVSWEDSAPECKRLERSSNGRLQQLMADNVV